MASRALENGEVELVSCKGLFETRNYLDGAERYKTVCDCQKHEIVKRQRGGLWVNCVLNQVGGQGILR